MASESGRARSYVGRLVTDRNGDMTLFIPLPRTEPADVSNNNDDPETETAADPESNSDPDEIRVVLVNPLNQSFIVLQGVSNFEALFKAGVPPASAAAIEALPEVEIGDDEEDVDCAICLEGMQLAKKLPCKHVFHGGCVEKWLRIHGSCPVCRFQMPVGEHSLRKGGDDVDNNGGVGREIWIPFSVRTVAVENPYHNSNQETEDHQSSD
ncbi:hypothetical protein QQ045_019761 [Rhodiola kirilowii]